MRSIAAVIILFVVVLVATPAHASRFVFGADDQRSGVLSGPASTDLVLNRMYQMNARWKRVMVDYPRIAGQFTSSYRGKVRWNFWRYDNVVAQAHAHGLNVYMVISCRSHHWSPQAYAEYVRRIVQHFKDEVFRWAPCNEPNYKGWLSLDPGEDASVVYRQLYLAAYAVIKQVQPQSQVLAFEMSAGGYPFETARGKPGFFWRVLCDDGNREGRCYPLQADGFAIHLYPDGDPHQSEYPRAAGYSSLDAINHELARASGDGLLETPAGDQPDIYITETGWPKQIKDSLRSSYWSSALDMACAADHVVFVSAYQIQSVPEKWNTGLIGASKPPDKTFWTIVHWPELHPGCMITDVPVLPVPNAATAALLPTG